MTDDIIPDKDNVSRFCKPSQAPNGKVQGAAFLLREDEPSLSVNWLEILGFQNIDERVDRLKDVFSKKFSNIRANARFAILNVGITREKVKNETSDGRDLIFVHDPKSNDETHSLINNLCHEDIMIAELIRETITNTYPAKK